MLGPNGVTLAKTPLLSQNLIEFPFLLNTLLSQKCNLELTNQNLSAQLKLHKQALRFLCVPKKGNYPVLVNQIKFAR